ncbi:22088_t:CDS:2 [Cetraspora pellucida]|uniref:22088_t:CDS:1 n=1 Tax=Cetraspora pellucida TaxID=1433469 RepID=A0A9N9A2D2_9GLOM|nr:22088_t:CDS:2 [Cetraspora pellucida]
MSYYISAALSRGWFGSARTLDSIYEYANNQIHCSGKIHKQFVKQYLRDRNEQYLHYEDI